MIATPRLHEAMRGEHRDEFLSAMGKEIAELEAHGIWTIVRKESMSDGANLLPSTWALKIKRYPDGRMRKNNLFLRRYKPDLTVVYEGF